MIYVCPSMLTFSACSSERIIIVTACLVKGLSGSRADHQAEGKTCSQQSKEQLLAYDHWPVIRM